jgi:DNA repair exonuclease SbcCD nuclease subunit
LSEDLIMKTKFIHTADWQLGKAFASVEDPRKRGLLQQERIQTVKRIGEVARQHGAEFILVAGDLFDSPSATCGTVSAACAAIGSAGIPVLAIPGNHDHGGSGSLWEQPFFRREQEQLAPNLKVLLAPEPCELETAVIFPCPLLRRRDAMDATGWLRSFADDGRFGEKPRLILAHGSVQGFGLQDEDEEGGSAVANFIDLSRLPAGGFDYIALGDWHGAKQAGSNAWYSGTPELDRFPKGADHKQGHVLVVEARRNAAPEVKLIPTGQFGWEQLDFDLADDQGVDQLEERVTAILTNRVQEVLLALTLRGSLGIEASARLEEKIEAWRPRLLRLKLSNQTLIAPSPSEIEALTHRTSDPLISRAASKLLEQAGQGGEEAAVARIALRELHAFCLTN